MIFILFQIKFDTNVNNELLKAIWDHKKKMDCHY
jgi:hypothetical protein